LTWSGPTPPIKRVVASLNRSVAVRAISFLHYSCWHLCWLYQTLPLVRSGFGTACKPSPSSRNFHFAGTTERSATFARSKNLFTFVASIGPHRGLCARKQGDRPTEWRRDCINREMAAQSMEKISAARSRVGRNKSFANLAIPWWGTRSVATQQGRIAASSRIVRFFPEPDRPRDRLPKRDRPPSGK